MLRVDRSLAYSQNLIFDPNFVRRLLSKVHINNSDTVIEIGAGNGIITKELAKQCKQVIALELDPVLYKKLSENTSHLKNVMILQRDFLTYKLPNYPYKIFSNLPFNLTSRIMRKLFVFDNSLSGAYFIIQKEAMERYMGTPRETQISLLLKPFLTIELLCPLNKKYFKPKPGVYPAFVKIKKLSPPILSEDEYKSFQDFVVYGTTQWKPTLKNSFKKVFTHEQFKRLSHNLGFDLKATPLDLTFEQWSSLFKFYLNSVSENKTSIVVGSYAKQECLQRGLKKKYRTRCEII